MKPNCICSFSGSDKAPSELLHFYVGVDCVWKLFLGAPPPSFFFLKPPQICNAASFISKPLSPPPQILLPLLVPLLQGGTPFRPACNSLPHGPWHLLAPCTEGAGLPLTCLVAFCSSKCRASAWPAASSCSCLAVSIWCCLWDERAQTITNTAHQ